MSDALVQSMKTGHPAGTGLPDWPRYTTAKGETMILDDQCGVENDPDREAVAPSRLGLCDVRSSKHFLIRLHRT